MQLIKSIISRKNLYKRIYDPCETIKLEKIAEEINVKFYDEAAEFLAQIYLIKKGDDCCAKELG